MLYCFSTITGALLHVLGHYLCSFRSLSLYFSFSGSNQHEAYNQHVGILFNCSIVNSQDNSGYSHGLCSGVESQDVENG